MIVDNYGPGKFASAEDLSRAKTIRKLIVGAYIARKIAVDLLAKYSASEVIVKLAYAIGIKDPAMQVAIVDGKEIIIEGYDLSPKEFLKS